MTDRLHAIGLLTGFAAIAGGTYLAWGIGYSLIVSGALLMAAVMRARALSGAAE